MNFNLKTLQRLLGGYSLTNIVKPQANQKKVFRRVSKYDEGYDGLYYEKPILTKNQM